MPRSTSIRVAIVLAGLVALTASAAFAHDEPHAPTGSAAALLAALEWVPDSPATRENMVSYLDQAAVPAARPGAAQPRSIAELEALLSSDDPSAGLWLAAMRCDNGRQLDIASADRSLPFGADLGRSEPLAVSDGDILSSADVGTLTAMTTAADGVAPSLADDPGYRAVAGAADPEVTLIQATLLPGGMLGLGPDIYRSFSESPEEAGKLVVTLDERLEPMPPAQIIGILDGATMTEQVVTIALAYADEADATVAADVLPRRLATMPSLLMGPLSELLAERDVTSVTGRVMPAGEGTAAAAVVELRAALAGPVPASGGARPAASSRLYRLFVDMVLRRDLLWLVPVLPLE